jgi:anti-sigma regulatory factor (Ser/Thr protein kinase)
VVIGGWRGPGWRVFAADPRCCAEARNWIKRAVAGRPSAADPDDAALAASEFFGNAIRHGPGGLVLVAYCLWNQGARIVVCDAGGRGVPHMLDGGRAGQENGRGLYTVNAISARWGTFVCGCSRVVWCDLAQPLAAAAADAWAWLPQILAGTSLAPPQAPASPPKRTLMSAADAISVTPDRALAG